MPMPLLRLYLWRHRLLLLGPGFDTGLHRHHAAQLCFGLHAVLRLRTDRARQWTRSRGFYVAPDEPHEFAASTTSTAIVYLDAESAEFSLLRRSLKEAASVTCLSPPTRSLADLQRIAAEGGTLDEANAACLSLLGLQAAAAQRSPFDPRIAQCLNLIRARLDEPLRLLSLASALSVSESWLTHRFRKEVGLPIRRYVLWQRLARAVELALKGSTLTLAAHAAGLSDSAHLSRTFREMFGVTPSFLFERRDQLAVTFEEPTECSGSPSLPR